MPALQKIREVLENTLTLANELKNKKWTSILSRCFRAES
jgi:hypothetical protein